jgi:hypothetical protein
MFCAAAFALTSLTATACFGDNEGSALQILGVEAPLDGVDAELGRAPVTVRFQAEREEQLDVAMTSTLGTFTPAQSLVITGLEGEATFTPEFLAGAEGGDAQGTATVTNPDGDVAQLSFSFPVVPLTRVGETAQLPNLSSLLPNYLEGQSITLAAPGRLRKVGLFAAGTSEVVVGLYSDVAGEPTALLTSVTGLLKAGVNELVVPEVTLPAGTYWFMSNYRASAPTYRSAAMRPLKYVSRTFSTVLPATYPAIYNDTTEPQRNVYLVLGR